MSVKVESKNPNSANKTLGKKNNNCDLMQTLFPYNGATVPFKHWPTGHSANNVDDADLLSAVVLQVHSVPSEHKQSLTPFQDIIQEYLCQPNRTTAGKTVWFASQRDGYTLRSPSKAKQKDPNIGCAHSGPSQEPHQTVIPAGSCLSVRMATRSWHSLTLNR